MNRTLLIMGCSQTKRTTNGLLPAIDRYDGSPYRVLRSHLRKNGWPTDLSVAVLSAKYGLVGGFTGIENYDLRMTARIASTIEDDCIKTMETWATDHEQVFLSLGKDYLPAVQRSLGGSLKTKASVFEGPIGMKLSQIKNLLSSTTVPPEKPSTTLESNSDRIKYFLPDWDDRLDSKFNFETDEFSGSSPKARGDKHCSILMKPNRMCDGVLVSLAQKHASKGPMKKLIGTEAETLAPQDMRSRFGLRKDQWLFGDCGAFSYSNEQVPTISVENAASLYDLHGFDFGASVDHIPVPYVQHNGKRKELTKKERKRRVELTIQNAQLFLDAAMSRKATFTPVGTIQGLSPQDYAHSAKLYHSMGYRHLALGGLVPLQDTLIEAIVSEVMAVVNKLTPRPWVHLFGVFRPKLQNTFRRLKVNSFDSATYFRKAWLRSDQNYLSVSGKWYAAIRVPMTKDGRTRARLLESGLDLENLELQEVNVMKLLNDFDNDSATLIEVLDAVLEYDSQLIRTSDLRSLKANYKQTLEDKPWRNCKCRFCRSVGIHMLIFRGANRNKRRGAHNTLMLYKSLK